MCGAWGIGTSKGMRKEIVGNALACLWLAMSSYGLFPLGNSVVGLITFCYAVVLLFWAGFRTKQWPIWKWILLVLSSGILGMLTRWLAEYGEVWWQINFTVENMVRHLVALVACSGLSYLIFKRLAEKQSA